jgi:tetratricopeptide (TPR) repeat protein
MGRMADIFVSYTSSDRDWAFWIGHELEALGHSPHIHEWELTGGANIGAWMEEQHHKANHVLLVISAKYLKAPYSAWERLAAQWAAASERPNFALPVFVESCEVPTLLAHIKRCDLFGLSEEEARASLKGFLASPKKPGRAPFPGAAKPRLALATPFPGKRSHTNETPRICALPDGEEGSVEQGASSVTAALSNIPIRVPTHFMGRDDALADIDKALARYKGRVAITALHGLRGVGKSTLAAAYAERHGGDHRATWWIRAQTKSGMRADLTALGVQLNWVAADQNEESALKEVLERLRREGDGILLIYDNALAAADIKPYLPNGGAARVLVTSNAHAWRTLAELVEIRLWPKTIGADYLIARTGRAAERAAAEALSQTLGGLPLAHEQAAAYCERLDISLAEYRERYQAAPERLLDDTRDAPTDYHDGLTVAKTFALAIEEAAKLHDAAEPLIEYAALLAPEPIPLFLFEEARQKFGRPLASMLAGDGLDEAVAALLAFALVDRVSIADERQPSLRTNCISLHRLVRQVAAARRAGDWRKKAHKEAREKARRTLMEAVAAVFPENISRDQNAWPRARRLEAHAVTLVEGDALLPGTEETTAKLLTAVGRYRDSALADYEGALPMFRRALAIREKVSGPEHPDIAANLNVLARLLQVQGDLAEARRLFKRALAICEKNLGPEDPFTAMILNNLGVLLQEQGDLQGSRPLKDRALAIREKVFGPKDPTTARSLLSVALLLRQLGDLAGSRPMFERALAISEEKLGPEHFETALYLNNLADLLKDMGDLAGARPLFDRALAIHEKVLGPEHPYTAISLNHLALLLQAQGDLAGARPLFERALAIREKRHEDRDTATILDNLATLLAAQDDHAGARCLRDRARAIRKRVPGPDTGDKA